MPVSNNAPSEAVPADVLQALRSFRLIVRSIKLHFQHVQSSTGLSSSQLWCLAAVRGTPGLRVSQLAESLGVRQATASNLVDVLERRALLERRRDTQDQRVVRLHLTSEGASRAQTLPPPAAGVLPDALGRLQPEALLHLNGLLDELIGLMRLDRDDTPPGPLGEG